MANNYERRSIRIAALGCGGWGRNIVRTLQNVQGVAAVVDPTETGRSTAKDLAPDASIHAEPTAVFADDTIDAVMIATPAETHFDLAKRAIEAGKDVFVEKPLTTDLEEARALVQLAEAHDRVLMVGHLLEYHPALLRLHELINEGELGEVRYIVSNRLNLGKVRTEENALWSFAPHDIAVILRLVGADPERIVATGGSYLTPGIADATVTQLAFPSGVRAHIFVSWLHPFKEQKLVVVGSKKMATFDDVNKQLVLHDQRVDFENGQPVPIRGEGTPVAFDQSVSPLEAEVRHFIERVADRRRPLTDGASGVRVLEILHAAQESMDGEGTPVHIEPADTPRAVVTRREGAAHVG